MITCLRRRNMFKFLEITEVRFVSHRWDIWSDNDMHHICNVSRPVTKFPAISLSFCNMIAYNRQKNYFLKIFFLTLELANGPIHSTWPGRTSDPSFKYERRCNLFQRHTHNIYGSPLQLFLAGVRAERSPPYTCLVTSTIKYPREPEPEGKVILVAVKAEGPSQTAAIFQFAQLQPSSSLQNKITSIRLFTFFFVCL